MPITPADVELWAEWLAAEPGRTMRAAAAKFKVSTATVSTKLREHAHVSPTSKQGRAELREAKLAAKRQRALVGLRRRGEEFAAWLAANPGADYVACAAALGYSKQHVKACLKLLD